MANILATITKACREHDLAHSTFGRLAVGDPCLIPDLYRGRTIRADTAGAVTAFLSTLAHQRPARRNIASGPRGQRHRPSRAAACKLDASLQEAQHRGMMRLGSALLLYALGRASKGAGR